MNREKHGQVRAGKLTSSYAKIIMSGNYDRWDRLADLLRDPPPFYEAGPNAPAPLRWGVQYEPEARALFWNAHPEFDVEQPGFVYFHDEDDELFWMVGDSPDGHVMDWDNGKLVAAYEGKAPYNQVIHQRNVSMPYVHPEYVDQCYWHCFVAGIDRCYFTSYDPRLKSDVRFVERILDVEPKRMAKMEELTRRFVRGFEIGETFANTPRSLVDFANL